MTDTDSLRVDPSAVLPGDLVRLENGEIRRVVTRPSRDDDGDYRLRAVVLPPVKTPKQIALADVVRHVDREDEEAIDQEPAEDQEPTDVDEEAVAEAVERAETEGVSLDDVLPRGASTHIKKIPSGTKKRRYVYANWREDGEMKSKYIGPASRFGK
jgi:hypothetical protein